MRSTSVRSTFARAVMVGGLALLLATAGIAHAQMPPSPDSATPPAPAPQAAPPPSPQPAPAPPADAARPTRPQAAVAAPAPVARLPADSTTEHVLDLPGQSLRFKATAGSIPLLDGDGTLQAEVAYVAFVVDGGSTATRPVAFVFNGGPGAASAYLNLGAIGPWRLPFAGISPSTLPMLVPNAETWLTFTDLVFIDPVGTGYSRATSSGDAARRQFWSVDGDVESIAVVIRKWTERAGRQTSLKLIVGESYGGFRAPRVARVLLDNQGLGVGALFMVSPVLDFGWRVSSSHAPMTWVGRLPSMAAAARELKDGPGAFDREALRPVEQYAIGDYLRDFLRGERDAAAVERMSSRVAALTGLDLALVRRLAGRVDATTFERELRRDRGLVGSTYDATVTGFDPHPYSATSRYSDPMLSALAAPLTTAMTDLYRNTLKWVVDAPYQLLNGDVNARWDWGRGRPMPQNVDDLRSLLALDKRVRVLVAHGATDLVTPYFENQIILDQLPLYGPAERVKFALYGGGHMFYSRDVSRRAWRADSEALVRALQQTESVPRN